MQLSGKVLMEGEKSNINKLKIKGDSTTASKNQKKRKDKQFDNDSQEQSGKVSSKPGIGELLQSKCDNLSTSKGHTPLYMSSLQITSQSSANNSRESSPDNMCINDDNEHYEQRRGNPILDNIMQVVSEGKSPNINPTTVISMFAMLQDSSFFRKTNNAPAHEVNDYVYQYLMETGY